MHRRHYLLPWFILALCLAACKLGNVAQATATQSGEVGELTQSPGPELASIPTLEGKPPQTNAAEIRPPERREELTRLTALLDYQVTGLEGSALGKVVEYIINTCETYIIYFLVEPTGELGVEPGHQLMIPFEAVTINSGILDAEHKTIALYLAPAQVAAAPAFANPLPLFPNTWEESVRAYWKNPVRIGKLSSECGTFGIQKIAYSRQLLGAELKDFNQNVLGTVREAILEPESGKLGFYVVELKNDQSFVLVPLGKTNIPEEALEPGNTFALVLLTENATLLSAPRITSMDEATSAEAQNTARQYWNR